MKGYKLVTVLKDGTMVSLVPSHYRLTYALGKTTTPKIGKLFVFSTYKDALALAHHLGGEVPVKDKNPDHFEILQGTATSMKTGKGKKVVAMSVYPCWKNPNSKKITWSWRDNGSKTSCPGWRCPVENGTLFCDEFTPTKLIR